MNRRMTLAAMLIGTLTALGGSVAENPYGACSHLTRTGYEVRDRHCALLGDAGAGWVRMDFDWRYLARRGDWDFKRYDEIVDSAEKAGVKVLPILSQPPEKYLRVWEHLEEWSEFVRTVARRYGRRIPVYEIWNEEDCVAFWKFTPNATNYLAVLRSAYEAIKSVDPALKVGFGGITAGGRDFAEEVLKLGGSKSFDVMCVHPYVSHHRTVDSRPEGELDEWLADMKARLAKYGAADKELWITEIGWPSPRVIPGTIPGLIKSGMSILRPGQTKFRVLISDPSADGDGAPSLPTAHGRGRPPGVPDGRVAAPSATAVGNPAIEYVLQDLTEADVTLCGFRDLAAKLQELKPDILVNAPGTQVVSGYAADEIAAYVKNGGVMVVTGGLPFYMAMTDRGGDVKLGGSIRRRLSITPHNWWDGGRPKEAIEVFPTKHAVAVEGTTPGRKYRSNRFLTGTNLPKGAEFIPLMSAVWTNGAECVSAAVTKFPNGGGLLIDSAIGSGHMNVFSERVQAKFLARSALIAFRGGVDKFLWYELRTHDFDRPVGMGDNGWGIVHADNSPRPGYEAFKALIARRPAGSVELTDRPWRDGALFCPSWRRPDGRICQALWTTNLVTDASLPSGTLVKEGRVDESIRTRISSAAKFYDLFGRSIDRTDVKISGEVVYCEWDL